MKRLGLYIFSFLCLIGISFTKGSTAIEEYNAKALFIFNFTKYIEWQEKNEKDDFKIAVFKKCEITEQLKKVAEFKKIQNRRFLVNEITEFTQEENVHILFLPYSTSIGEYVQLLKNTNHKNLLIISENKKLFQYGTSINFVVQENKIKFEINLSSIENAELKVSSQLLKLATRVKK